MGTSFTKLISCDHETTQGEYEQYMTYYGRAVSGTETGASGSSEPYVPTNSYGYGPNYPAYYVCWYEAIMYCNLRSVAEGLTPVYYIMKDGVKLTDIAQWVDETGKLPGSNIKVSDGKFYYNSRAMTSMLDYNGDTDTDGGIQMDLAADGWRLPTDAEWEYLARGGNVSTTGQLKYSGTDSDIELTNYAWYRENSGTNGGDYSTGGKNHEVKTKLPNALNLYDMSGNAAEWCWDWSINSSDIDSSTPETGPSSGTNRICRGGDWTNFYFNCSVTGRRIINPQTRYKILGFRVVRSSN